LHLALLTKQSMTVEIIRRGPRYEASRGLGSDFILINAPARSAQFLEDCILEDITNEQ